MDIGGVIGAIVLHTPDCLAGQEIEIWPEGGTTPTTHAVVRPRLVRNHLSFAAVFPAVRAGDYTLRSARDPEATPRSVAVKGGEVTEADWYPSR